MTRETAKLALPLIQAWADGKIVQWNNITTWMDCDERSYPMFNIDEAVNHPSNYRIKPEPKLRAWKPEEVPVGALIRCKHKPENIAVILGVTFMLPSGAIVQAPIPEETPEDVAQKAEQLSIVMALLIASVLGVSDIGSFIEIQSAIAEGKEKP